MSPAPFEKHGPWQIKKKNAIYEDPWLTVQQDDVVRPDGLEGSYSTVRIKPGVCVVAVDSEGIMHLTREFHYAVGRDTVEGVSGGIEEGETPEIAAMRELREELGIIACQLSPLGIVDPLTSALWSPTTLYLAEELVWGEASPEGTEQIECVSYPIATAVEMVMRSQITHGPTCTAILKIYLQICGRVQAQ